MPRTAIAALTALTLCAVPVTQAHAQFENESVQAFLSADANGDELLTLDEFRSFIRYMAAVGAPMSQRIQNLAAYRVAFGRVDRDGDGYATPDELRAAERQN